MLHQAEENNTLHGEIRLLLQAAMAIFLVS